MTFKTTGSCTLGYRGYENMGKLTIEDVIYTLETPYPDFEIKRGKTALVLIDIQKIASPEPFVNAAIKKGLPEKDVREAVADYEKRFWQAVDNAAKILKVSRLKGMDVVHVVLEAPTKNPLHTAKVNRKIGLVVQPASEESRSLDAVKPLPDELLVAKTNGGAFAGTNLDFILRNMDIDSLILVGFLTDECVAATAYHASDIGYDVLLVRDACATHRKEAHDAIIWSLDDMCLKVYTTDEVLRKLEALPNPR
jgi:nicotinamidase-related amidase